MIFFKVVNKFSFIKYSALCSNGTIYSQEIGVSWKKRKQKMFFLITEFWDGFFFFVDLSLVVPCGLWELREILFQPGDCCYRHLTSMKLWNCLHPRTTSELTRPRLQFNNPPPSPVRAQAQVRTRFKPSCVRFPKYASTGSKPGRCKLEPRSRSKQN